MKEMTPTGDNTPVPYSWHALGMNVAGGQFSGSFLGSHHIKSPKSLPKGRHCMLQKREAWSESPHATQSMRKVLLHSISMCRFPGTMFSPLETVCFLFPQPISRMSPALGAGTSSTPAARLTKDICTFEDFSLALVLLFICICIIIPGLKIRYDNFYKTCM